MAARRMPWFLAAAGALGGCVSMEETRMNPQAIHPGQRTVLLVYAAPGPFVAEDDSKAESAAKIVPGLGLLVKSFQDDRQLEASKSLQQYLPPSWRPETKFLPALNAALAKTGHKGRFVTPQEAEITVEDLRKWNRSEHLVDWQQRYYVYDPENMVPRNYAKMLALDDAVVFEVNLTYGATTDGEGNAWPAAAAATKIFRANTMRQFWRHEDAVDDRVTLKSLYEFKTQPSVLTDAWDGLLPLLAEKIAASYQANLEPQLPLPGTSDYSSPTNAQPAPVSPWLGGIPRVSSATAPAESGVSTHTAVTTSTETAVISSTETAVAASSGSAVPPAQPPPP